MTKAPKHLLSKVQGILRKKNLIKKTLFILVIYIFPYNILESLGQNWFPVSENGHIKYLLPVILLMI